MVAGEERASGVERRCAWECMSTSMQSTGGGKGDGVPFQLRFGYTRLQEGCSKCSGGRRRADCMLRNRPFGVLRGQLVEAHWNPFPQHSVLQRVPEFLLGVSLSDHRDLVPQSQACEVHIQSVSRKKLIEKSTYP